MTDSGTTLSWQALTGEIHNSGLNATTQLSWPELDFTTDGDRVTLRGLAVNGSAQKQQADDPLGVGEQVFTLKSMTYSAASGEAQGKFNLSDLKVGGRARWSAASTAPPSSTTSASSTSRRPAAARRTSRMCSFTWA